MSTNSPPAPHRVDLRSSGRALPIPRHARTRSTAVRFSLRRASRPAFPAPSPCLPPSSCPDLIRASTGAAAPPDGALYRWRQWLRGSSPRMGGRIKSGHDGVGVAVEEYGSRVRPAPPVGARNEAGVTTEGQGRQVRACGDPCPDPADAPISRPEQGFAPGPAHPNRTAVDSFRASLPARAACRQANGWTAGTGPGMTRYGRRINGRSFGTGTPAWDDRPRFAAAADRLTCRPTGPSAEAAG